MRWQELGNTRLFSVFFHRCSSYTRSKKKKKLYPLAAKYTYLRPLKVCMYMEHTPKLTFCMRGRTGRVWRCRWVFRELTSIRWHQTTTPSPASELTQRRPWKGSSSRPFTPSICLSSPPHRRSFSYGHLFLFLVLTYMNSVSHFFTPFINFLIDIHFD